MSNTIVLLVSTENQLETSRHASGQPIRISLPQGATLGTRDEASGRWAPLVAKKSTPRVPNDWSVLD